MFCVVGQERFHSFWLNFVYPTRNKAVLLLQLSFDSVANRFWTISMGQAVCNWPNMENCYNIWAFRRVTSYYDRSISFLGTKICLPHSEWSVLHPEIVFGFCGDRFLTISMEQAVYIWPRMENLYKIYTFRRVTSYFYGKILLLGTKVSLPNSEWHVLYLKLCFFQMGAKVWLAV